MKQVYFLDYLGRLETSIELQGEFVIAYSFRLWKSMDKALELVEELRGSCFNNECKKITYTTSKQLDKNYEYFLELDANISTIKLHTPYHVKLEVSQLSDANKQRHVGVEELNGEIGYNDGGKFLNLGVSLAPTELNKMAS